MPAKNYIGGLTRKKLTGGIDFISAGFGWMVSKRMAELMQGCGVECAFGPVRFRAKDHDFGDYYVIELEPRLIWTAAERERYQLTVCEYCGECTTRSNRSSFAQKEFAGSVFSKPCVLVRSAENRGFCINEGLYGLLVEAAPKGVSFKKVGTYP